jgi:hypothetical protein
MSTVFVNLSNHPYAIWSEEQLATARGLADQVVDIPIPEIPPDAGTDELVERCRILALMLPVGATHAMVSTEFVTTFILIKMLQKRGITCLAATTRRSVSMDPAGNKVSRFSFVRFREYPDFREL